MTQRTYSERREARQNRLDARAEKAKREAAAQYGKARQILDMIPPGQPILVGHHSERGHRRDLARVDGYMGKSVAAAREAERLNAAAPTTAILASDADALEQLRAKIAQAEALHARMKAANPIARKGDVASLVALGFSEKAAGELVKPDFAGRVGFADWALSNNGANIRRMRQRLERLERAKARPASEQIIAGVRVEEDPEAMRLRLHFPGKPAPDIIAELKGSGFRWAPSVGAWQRQLNNAARWAAQSVLRKLKAGQGMANEPQAQHAPEPTPEPEAPTPTEAPGDLFAAAGM